MPKIPEDIIRHVEDSAKIEDVIGDIIGWSPAVDGGLRKTGANYTCLCPFHADKNDGNFIVRPSTVDASRGGNTYRCFVCEKKGGPVTFLMEHERLSFPDAIRWLGRKYNIPVDDIPLDYTPPPARPKPEPLPTLFIPRKEVMKRTGHLKYDNLALWILSLPWDCAQMKRISEVFYLYCLGHVTIRQQQFDGSIVNHEFTVFWQIDYNGNPRTAHYMKYKPDGHRIKKEQDRYHTDWFHSLLERNNVTSIYDKTKREARQCLFGEHLLKHYPNATVNIVESEKTAILMAIAYGNNPMQVWVACAGSSNINREHLRILIEKGRRIVLYPDRDGIALWKTRAEALAYKNVSVDTRPVTKWWKECDGPKADIADIIVRSLLEHGKFNDVRCIVDVMNEAPELKPLIEKLQLKIDNGNGEKEL